MGEPSCSHRWPSSHRTGNRRRQGSARLHWLRIGQSTCGSDGRNGCRRGHGRWSDTATDRCYGVIWSGLAGSGPADHQRSCGRHHLSGKPLASSPGGPLLQKGLWLACAPREGAAQARRKTPLQNGSAPRRLDWHWRCGPYTPHGTRWVHPFWFLEWGIPQ